MQKNEKIKGYKYKSGDLVCLSPFFRKAIKFEVPPHIAFPDEFYCSFYFPTEERLASMNQMIDLTTPKKEGAKTFDPYNL